VDPNGIPTDPHNISIGLEDDGRLPAAATEPETAAAIAAHHVPAAVATEAATAGHGGINHYAADFGRGRMCLATRRITSRAAIFAS
jgi:hypothetical protein